MDISDLRDTHSGERVFLIGNGPSLKQTPLDRLRNEYTIAMNNIHRIYPEMDWRPDYYLNVQSPELVVNPTREWIDECVRGPMVTANSGIPCVFASLKRSLFPNRENIMYVDMEELHIDTQEMLYTATEGDIDGIWMRDLEEGVYRRHSSMYVAAQLASYMGFNELYFVGCDLYPEFKPFPHKLFDSGTDPQKYRRSPRPPGRNGYMEFLIEEGAPVRSAVNGLCYKTLRTDAIMRSLYRLLVHTGRLRDSHFTSGSRESHFVEDYNTRIYTDEGYIKFGTNRKFVLAHKLINAIGDIVNYDTYNATIGGQLEVHQRVDFTEIV